MENNQPNGHGNLFNYIMSNGDQTKGRDKKYQSEEVETYHIHMIPEDAYTGHKKIRAVEIYYTECVYGFRFLDRDNKVIFRIGYTGLDYGTKVLVVPISSQELIIGVQCKLFKDYQTLYTDFQFQIAHLV